MEKNYKYIHDNKIITRRLPIEDEAQEFEWGWFYKDGTLGYHNAFPQIGGYIAGYKHFYWILSVIWYLNEDMTEAELEGFKNHINNPDNGFTDCRLKYVDIKRITKNDTDYIPSTKLRKVIFKEGTGLTVKEKCSIAGKLISGARKITSDGVYQCMLELNEDNKGITNRLLADMLGVARRTIQRNTPSELKEEIKVLNNKLNK
jgi:hypothetical protein